eukprot:TRINITY_DN39395_c1_g2_i4.p1 TRINITY_DN39395_c1_g2~~TRINITY_DN39395_c1_g2_i4.p1  ORF type:complete len:471 (+),score=92.93 TRINITY_DN39395_c1_g2_i4:29-1441(+)
MFTVLSVLCGVCMAAGGLLFSPLGRAKRSLLEEDLVLSSEEVRAQGQVTCAWRRGKLRRSLSVEGASRPGDTQVNKWRRTWLVKLQRNSGKDLTFDGFHELADFGKLLPRSGVEEDDSSPNDNGAKRRAVAIWLGQHFRSHWAATKKDDQPAKLGTRAWNAAYDRPTGNLPMPGAELDLRPVGVGCFNAAVIPPMVSGGSSSSSSTGKEVLLPAYIATQHPMPSTVQDFWRMVVAKKPACIVMLNAFDYATVGDGDEECVKYWEPEAVASCPGMDKIDLQVLSEEKVPRHHTEDVVRRIRVSLKEENGSVPSDHEVDHLCISWWQDQTQPPLEKFVASWRLMQSLLCKRQAMRDPDRVDCTDATVVVHCTGGIGRAGVWIAADMSARALTSQPAASGPFVSPDQAIRHLRSRRVNMIQNEGQYFFLHYVMARLVAILDVSAPLPELQVLTATLQRTVSDKVDFARTWSCS